MRKFKHTDRTAKIFNGMLHDYQGINSDSDLEKRKLSYDTYKYMGFPIDQLRYDGETVVKNKDFADYLQRFGFNVNQQSDGYFVSFE